MGTTYLEHFWDKTMIDKKDIEWQEIELIEMIKSNHGYWSIKGVGPDGKHYTATAFGTPEDEIEDMDITDIEESD